MSSVTHIKDVYWKRLAIIATATARAISALGKRGKARSLGNDWTSSFLFDRSSPPGSGVFALFRNLQRLFRSLGNQGRVQTVTTAFPRK